MRRGPPGWGWPETQGQSPYKTQKRRDTQRRSHVETEAEAGGRRPPAQGRTPGAPRSRKRQEGPSPGASAGSSALGPLELRCLVPRSGGARMILV